MKLQTFGIELRSINSKNLFNDVDSFLQENGGVNKQLQAETVQHTLTKMLKPDSYISVCDIQKCAQVCSIIIPKERMDIYSSIHCMSWNEMLPEFRNKIVALIIDDFRIALGDINDEVELEDM